MIALLITVFAFQLNASMLSPALSTMEKELGTSAAQVGLTQTAFFAAAALFSLFLPRWGDLAGHRKILMGMLLVTACGCVISALAPNVAVLGIGRVIQGVAGPIVPLCLIMLHVQVPDQTKYAKLMAVITSVNGGIAGVDSLAGGYLVGNFGFRSIFWVMAAICALAAIALLLWAPESRATTGQPMDWPGVIALMIVLAGFYFAFQEAGKLAAANWLQVAGLIVIALIAFKVFWSLENRSNHPLVATHYLKQRRTWGLLATTLLTMTGVFAVMNALIPNLAQDENRGVDLAAATVSWWTLSPYAIAGLLMGPVAGQLAARLGFKRVLQLGLVGTIIALVLAVLLTPSFAPVTLLAISIFVGITYAGMCNIMLNGLGVVLSPEDNPGILPGLNAGAFNLGAGLSFAVLLAAQAAFPTGSAAGYQAGIITGAVLVAAALATSFLIPTPKESTQPAI